jgi:hypothetical protein
MNKEEQLRTLEKCRQLEQELYNEVIKLMDTIQKEGRYPTWTKEQAKLHKDYIKLMELVKYAGYRIYQIAFGLGFDNF